MDDELSSPDCSAYSIMKTYLGELQTQEIVSQAESVSLE